KRPESESALKLFILPPNVEPIADMLRFGAAHGYDAASPAPCDLTSRAWRLQGGRIDPPVATRHKRPFARDATTQSLLVDQHVATTLLPDVSIRREQTE